MSEGIASVDHAVITVADLETARRVWAGLGFQLSPRGEHASLGTANHTAMFQDGTYLELLTVTAPGEGNRAFQAAIARHPDQVGGLALKTADAVRFHAARASSPFQPEAPVAFGRPVTLDGEVREACFTIVRLAQDSLPLPGVFACQHHTPELVWRHDLLEHPNGVTGLAALLFDSTAPRADALAFAAALGAEAGPLGPGWAVFGPGPFLGFVAGDASPRLSTRVLVFDAPDLARVAAQLAAAEETHLERLDGALLVPARPGRPFDCVFQVPGGAASAGAAPRFGGLGGAPSGPFS